MAISRLKGSQIKDKVLNNQHIADDAGIEESKLLIDWTAKHQEALESKKVIDFVQIADKDVSNVSELDLSAIDAIPAIAPVATSTGSDEGVLIDAPHNQAIIRNAATGAPIIDEAGKEVFGRIEKVEDAFVVKFLTVDESDAEQVFVMPDNTSVDIQYMERFNLKTVSELFAANEKFVSGAADITAHQNIVQLAKDIYGAGYQLDRDGEGNLQVSLIELIANETTAREEAIGLEQTARAEAITQLKNKLASTEDGEGASLIGLQDALDLFAAENVEDALIELAGRLKNVEDHGGGDASAVTQEVEASRGSAVTLNERLGKALNEDGTLKAGTLIHKHYRARFVALGNEEEVLLSEFNKLDLPNFQVGDDSLEVYINGQLQEPGLNYEESPQGDKVVFNIGDGTALDVDDVVTIKYFVNNAE